VRTVHFYTVCRILWIVAGSLGEGRFPDMQGGCPVSAFHQDITSGFPTIHSVVIPFLNQRTYIYGVQIDRRTFLEQIGAVALTPVLTGSQEANSMWGLIAKLTLLPGKRDEMIEILKESAADMPGCLSYVVAKDAADENTIWVTEVWDSMSSHDASLSLPAVKNAIPRGKAIASNFEKIAVTSPVWGAGLPAAHTH
jgi:quinol monooxygenase YgiN